jgi:hypothetical protein
VTVIEEAQRLPPGAAARARGIAWIKPPDHLPHLVSRVRHEHAALLQEVHRAIDARLAGQHLGEVIGAFYAASELALIADAWPSELAAADRANLRACWEDLLAA